MTKDRINIAIAEYCGYQYGPLPQNKNQLNWTLNGVQAIIPNYYGDLNAMHEAEKSLGEDVDQWLLYDRYLAETAPGFTFHATAAERAECFLRVKGLWVDAGDETGVKKFEMDYSKLGIHCGNGGFWE